MDRDASAEPRFVAATLDDLAGRAAALAERGQRTILGLVGPPGAGKSTVCDALASTLGGSAVVVGMDGFHLADEVLVALGRRDRKGAPDTFDVAGYVSLLRRVRAAEEDVTYAPRFDRSIEASLGSAVPVPRSVPLVVTEGNHLLHERDGWQAVRPLLDEVWFLDVSAGERMRRLVSRRVSHGDSEDQARAWVTQVDEPNARVVLDSRDAADLVVTVTG